MKDNNNNIIIMCVMKLLCYNNVLISMAMCVL